MERTWDVQEIGGRGKIGSSRRVYIGSGSMTIDWGGNMGWETTREAPIFGGSGDGGGKGRATRATGRERKLGPKMAQEPGKRFYLFFYLIN